jgi:hypothetical protein
LRRQRRAAAWLNGTWVLLAWTVAVDRLWLAIKHHQVFGAETSIAFLVVVVLPLMRGPKLVRAMWPAAVALRRASAARRDANGEPHDAPPRPRSRSGHPLQ